MSLAATREKRANAGAKMSKLINEEEEEDEFYKTAYGGFTDETGAGGVDDNEFVFKEEDVEEDVVDSDFDMDENEDAADQNEEGDEEERNKKRSKRGVFTKAYKEPLSKKKSDTERQKQPKSSKGQEDPSSATTSSAFISEEFNNKVEIKSLRHSTAQKREELERRQKERDAKQKKSNKVASTASRDLDEMTTEAERRRLTQEELLAEAKITEKINMASLDAYQKLELEKRKRVVVKNVIKGPLIRYHSVTMPILSDDEDEDDQDGDVKALSSNGVKKQSRNFITFTDEQTLRDIFPTPPPPPSTTSKSKQQATTATTTTTVRAKLCAVTGLPAKYFDPVTQQPYANIYAFRALRQMHNKGQTKLSVTS